MTLSPEEIATQRCSLCLVDRPIEEFHRRGTGFQRWCKSCRRAWDAAYHARTKQVRLAQKRQAKSARLAWLFELKSRPCADCGGSFHPAAMQFDHLPGAKKLRDVSTLVVRGCTQMALEEIAKCELVCANCHAVRTYMRRGRLDEPDLPSVEEKGSTYLLN
ncbi:MAG: hypothetical protein ACRDGE_04615 [Candidatus Limnocylindria bacterium]